jgi:DNA-binding GntR family transcriptional regulator
MSRSVSAPTGIGRRVQRTASLKQASRKPRPEPNARNTLARFEAMVRRVVAKHDDRNSLVTEIACVVGAEILNGIRSPGTDVNSVELARRFATSRTPTREALMLLEKEGLVEVLPRRRPRVAALTLPEIREIYEVRAVIVGHVAWQAARNATAEELQGLRLLLREMERAAAAGEGDAYYWGNVAFHERLTDAAHNTTLRRILDTLVLRSLRLRRLSLAHPERVERSMSDHRNLMLALEDGDSELAGVQAKANVLSAFKVLERDLPKGEAGAQAELVGSLVVLRL